jgi:hypothetical protein
MSSFTRQELVSIALLVITCLPAATFGQSNPSSPDSPQVFGPGIISGPVHDMAPAFTPDGKTVYFHRSGPGLTGVILVSHLRDGGWSRPEIASFSGQWQDIEPAMSPDGAYLLFSSNRPTGKDGEILNGAWGGSKYPRRGGNLWRVDRLGKGWGQPHRLPDLINSDSSVFSPAITANGTLYFMKPVGHGGVFHLFRSECRDGVYQTVESLPFSAPDSVGEFDPAVAPDDSFIVFCSGRAPAKRTELWIVFRDGGGWGTPVSLGPAVNRSAGCVEARLSPDHRRLFFSTSYVAPPVDPSDRSERQAEIDRSLWQNGSMNIWSVSLDKWLGRSGSGHNSKPGAVEEFAGLQKEAQAAGKAGDHPGRLRAAMKIQRLLHNAPDAVEFTAQAYWENRDTSNTLRMLRLFAELGQTDTGLIGKTTLFPELQKLPQYQPIVQRLAANQTAVSRAETAFTLRDRNVLPEDIDFDPETRSFLITSVLQKKIIRLYEDGRETDFAVSPSGWPMSAVKIDAIHGLVWASEVAMNGFTSVASQDWGRSAVLCYDLRSGALRKRIEAAPGKALGDMTLTREGDPIVCDGEGGGVYRVVNDSLVLINDMDFISPQTPVMLPDGEHLMIPDYVRGIGCLSLRSNLVTWLDGGGGEKVALNGVDGLYFDQGTLILTQNGTYPECVNALQLDKSFTRVKSAQIIERGTATLGDPTHGVIVSGVFYYIANSGWGAIDAHGHLKAGGSLTPAKIMRFALRS